MSSSPASDGTVCEEGVEDLEYGEECKGGLCPGSRIIYLALSLSLRINFVIRLG